LAGCSTDVTYDPRFRIASLVGHRFELVNDAGCTASSPNGLVFVQIGAPLSHAQSPTTLKGYEEAWASGDKVARIPAGTALVFQRVVSEGLDELHVIAQFDTGPLKGRTAKLYSFFFGSRLTGLEINKKSYMMLERGFADSQRQQE
jgi:hypothetical protein